MKQIRWGRLAVVACLALPFQAEGQEPTAPPNDKLADATIVVTEEVPDSVGSLRISARLLDASTGETLETAEVSGQREDIYGLFVQLATQLMGSVEGDPGSEAQALFALGQLFEEQGHKDLAADAYQSVMKTHPELTEAREAWERLVGRWEINAYVGIVNDEPEFRASAVDDAFRRDAIFGVRGAYHFPSKIFVQAEVANTLVSYSANGVRQNLSAFPVLGAVGYTFLQSHDFHLFVAAGGGAVIWNPDITSREVNLDLNFGMGSRLFLTRNHVLRTDVRMHRVSNALAGTHAELSVEEGDPTLWGLELSVGMSWFPSGG